jgi:hypothetical protein
MTAQQLMTTFVQHSLLLFQLSGLSRPTVGGKIREFRMHVDITLKYVQPCTPISANYDVHKTLLCTILCRTTSVQRKVGSAHRDWCACVIFSGDALQRLAVKELHVAPQAPHEPAQALYSGASLPLGRD